MSSASRRTVLKVPCGEIARNGIFERIRFSFGMEFHIMSPFTKEGKRKQKAKKVKMSKETKYVYGQTGGNAEMRNLLGGKGANLAEMAGLGLPVPQGFTISTRPARGTTTTARRSAR